jgi:large subunit ribosomal protein L29
MKLVKEMRELSELELNEKVTDLKQELFNLRFQHAVNQLENPQRIKAVKKQIAIIKTIQRERELSATGAASGVAASN